MKTISPKIFYLLLAFVIISCGKDEDNQITPTEVDLFSVTVSNDYYFDIESGVKFTGHIILTNNAGEIITHGELDNYSTTTLRENYDLVNDNLNVTFIKKFEDDGYIWYDMATYNDVDQYTINIKAPSSIVKAEATVKLINTEERLEAFIYGYPAISSSALNNEAQYEIRLNKVPGNLYFTVKKESEDFKRYVLLKDVTGDTFESLEFNNLPSVNSNITLTYPVNDYVLTSIKGAENSDPDNFYAGLDQFHSYDGTTSHSFSVPDNLFQRYKVRVIIKGNGKTYTLNEKTRSVDLNYTMPDLDCEISATSGHKYSVSKTGTSDFYRTIFKYRDENGLYDIIWTVYGEANDNMNFSLPNIEDYIAEDFSNFSLDDLKPSYIGLKKVKGITTYEQFLRFIENPSSSEKQLIIKEEDLGKIPEP